MDSVDTDKLREEFNPHRTSRLGAALYSLDALRRKRDELRPEYEELRDRLNDTKEKAYDGSLDPMEQAQARMALPVLREAMREAQNKYELARGKARNQQSEVVQIVRKLRRFLERLEEIDEYRAEVQAAGNEWVTEQQAGKSVMPYRKTADMAADERRMRPFVANALNELGAVGAAEIE